MRNSASFPSIEIRFLQSGAMFWQILTHLNEIFRILVTNSGGSPFLLFSVYLGRELSGSLPCERSKTGWYTKGSYVFVFNKASFRNVLSSQMII